MCPRRAEAFVQVDKGPDRWGADKTCNYCGSLHPDEFMRRAEAGEELGPTDKNYKVYMSGSGSGKFYFQHLSEEQKRRFVDLLNEKKLKIGYPGRFYVAPFFITFGSPDK